MNNRNRVCATFCVAVFTGLITTFAFSATPDDIDSDNNGLIDITTLDELNQIRDDLTGSSLSGNTAGCPESGCFGYELMNDLDFDINANGDLSDDAFWNDGKGWQPIAMESEAFFSATLEGNGYSIRNLFIRREVGDVGFIAKTDGAKIANLTFDGPLTSITGSQTTGALIANSYASDEAKTLIENVHVNASVYSSGRSLGGLIGNTNGSDILNSHFSGVVETKELNGQENTGGLVGSMSDSTMLSCSVKNATVIGYENVGGVVGNIYRAKIESTHSLVDVSVTGHENVGGLIGYAWDAQNDNAIRITSSIATVKGVNAVGGLLGYGKVVHLHQSYSRGDVSGEEIVGGLIGFSSAIDVNNSYTINKVTSTNGPAGGMAGSASEGEFNHTFSASVLQSGPEQAFGLFLEDEFSKVTLVDSYWNINTAGIEIEDGAAVNGVTTEALVCPSIPTDSNCSAPAIFESWDATLWDFGNNKQYPALIFDGVVMRDFDLDGQLDSVDDDDDNDGIKDSEDAFPFDATETTDTDQDGVGDNSDLFPNDATETVDADKDGIGNNADTDDDNDGIDDVSDDFPFDSTETKDTDKDGIGDNTDVFPSDASEWIDSDEDGVGDNGDAFPFDNTETKDNDNDGVGNNSDAFPEDATETVDTDNDGIGNNADTDDDNDSVEDSDDERPLDATESKDTDNDGIGNNADTDDDGDGVLDTDDAFPLDASGALESDSIDKDNNGLIEITTLEQLNAIRDDLTGKTLNGISAGCPEAACKGVELMNDLDFDTNQDGVIDESDTYWNDGKGWAPIGDWAGGYSGVFEGNNHTIFNLHIDLRDEFEDAGLFSSIADGTIRNLTLAGELATVVGDWNVGALTGSAQKFTIINVHNQIKVVGEDSVGGLVGSTSHSSPGNLSLSSNRGEITGGVSVGGLIGFAPESITVKDSFNLATIASSDGDAGGLIGYLGDASLIERSYSDGAINSENGDNVGGLVGFLKNSEINNSYAIGSVTGANTVGGLVGFNTGSSFILSSYTNVNVIAAGANGPLIGADDDNDNNPETGAVSPLFVSYSYWNKDQSGVTDNGLGIGLTESDMTCPTVASDTSCASGVVYEQWDNTVWRFGTTTDYPVLIVHQESDKPVGDDQPGSDGGAKKKKSSGGSLNLWFILLMSSFVVFRRKSFRSVS